MPRVFISYRRQDADHAAARLHGALKSYVVDPKHDLFIDIDNIPKGVDFIEVLNESLAKCDVVLVVIGKRWSSIRDPLTDERRLDSVNDFVRMEIEVALSRNILVVPVAVDGASYPSIDELPQSISGLMRRNAHSVRHDSFEDDVARLVRAVPLPWGRIDRSRENEITHRESPSAAAWAMIQDSLDLGDYAEFERLYPGAAELMLASRQRRSLHAWGRLDHSDPIAIGGFLLSNPFASLRAHAERQQGCAAAEHAFNAGERAWAKVDESSRESLREFLRAFPDHSRSVQAAAILDRVPPKIEGAQLVGVLVGPESPALCLAFNQTGNRLVVGYWEKSLRVWDVGSLKEINGYIGHRQRVWSVEWLRDGKSIMSSSLDGRVDIWSATTYEEIVRHDFNIESGVRCARMSPVTDEIVAAVGDAAVIFDSSSGIERVELSGHADSVEYVSFSPDGRSVATASWDGTVRVWNVDNGRVLLTLSGHKKAVDSVEYSRAGDRIVTASEDGSAVVWDAATGKVQCELFGHEKDLNKAVFSRDGALVLTASSDGEARIWDSMTGSQLLLIKSKQTFLNDCAFAPDGATVALAGSEGNVEIWALVWES